MPSRPLCKHRNMETCKCVITTCMPEELLEGFLNGRSHSQAESLSPATPGSKHEMAALLAQPPRAQGHGTSHVSSFRLSDPAVWRVSPGCDDTTLITDCEPLNARLRLEPSQGIRVTMACGPLRAAPSRLSSALAFLVSCLQAVSPAQTLRPKVDGELMAMVSRSQSTFWAD